MLETSRTTLKRVLYLALAHRLTGRQRYTQRAQEEMLAAVRFEDWNPSHFLDVAEMTAALAVGYDWLYETLEPKAREEIKKAIVEKGLRVSLEEDGWVESKSNWSQVCHGGVVLGALAVLEDEPDLAAQICSSDSSTACGLVIDKAGISVLILILASRFEEPKIHVFERGSQGAEETSAHAPLETSKTVSSSLSHSFSSGLTVSTKTDWLTWS